MEDELIGKKIGAYQIQTLLGEGGMALVYKAYHEHLHREVARRLGRFRIWSATEDLGERRASYDALADTSGS